MLCLWDKFFLLREVATDKYTLYRYHYNHVISKFYMSYDKSVGAWFPILKHPSGCYLRPSQFSPCMNDEWNCCENSARVCHSSPSRCRREVVRLPPWVSRLMLLIAVEFVQLVSGVDGQWLWERAWRVFLWTK